MSGALGGPVLVLLAAAVLVWPRPSVRTRWQVLARDVGRTPRPSRDRWRGPHRAAPTVASAGPTGPGERGPGEALRVLCAGAATVPGPVVLGGSAAVGALAAGVGGAVAATLLAVVLRRARAAVRATRGEAATTAALAEALGGFAGELRGGAPPSVAARAAGADTDGRVAGVLRLIEATARLGGDVPRALHAAAGAGAAGAGLRRLADTWALAERHGIGLAGPAAALAVDLDARARFAARTRAQVAGPRATAVVLALLPVLGLLLGEGIGASPWAVLSGTGTGQVLLVVGVALVGAGLEWTERIVAGVAR